jgi:hypothetical protein
MSLEGLNNRFSFFDSLTADVKIEILDYLDDLDLKVVSIASKHFNEISLEAFKIKHRGLLQAYFTRIPFFYPIEEFTLRCHNLAEVNHSFHRLAEGFIQSQLKKSQTELEQMEASTLLMQPPLFFRKVFEGIYKIKEFLALKLGLEQEKKVGMIKEILLFLITQEFWKNAADLIERISDSQVQIDLINFFIKKVFIHKKIEKTLDFIDFLDESSLKDVGYFELVNLLKREARFNEAIEVIKLIQDEKIQGLTYFVLVVDLIKNDGLEQAKEIVESIRYLPRKIEAINFLYKNAFLEEDSLTMQILCKKFQEIKKEIKYLEQFE